MKTFTAKKESVQHDWFVVDATGKTLGRLASAIAHRLRGKHKPEYTPHVDTGDYIVVINAEQVRVTGAKTTDKMYYSHSGFPGGIKSINVAYNAAPPDGLSIYQLASGHYLQQLAGSSVVKFDLSKMPILGAWTRTTYALAVRADKFKSIEDIRNAKEPPLIGSQGIGTGTYLYTVGWQSALGIKFKVITGYQGGNAINLAMEKGEVQARNNTWSSWKVTKPAWIKLRRAPVVWNEVTREDARLYFTIEGLGLIDKLHAEIVKILNHANKTVIGRITHAGGYSVVHPRSEKLRRYARAYKGPEQALVDKYLQTIGG